MAAAQLEVEEQEEADEESSSGSESEEDVADTMERDAMAKAEKGDFIGDICVVCAFGLPKVDYWGSCDSFVKPMWDGSGEQEMLSGIKWDLKK